MFRKKNRCRNLSPSVHASYSGKRCSREEGHDGMCRARVGAYSHYWNQAHYERLNQARVKDS